MTLTEYCGHGVNLFAAHCDGCDRVWLRMCLGDLEKSILKQKRRAFDMGEHDCHIALSNAEAEVRKALRALTPAPLGSGQEE